MWWRRWCWCLHANGGSRRGRRRGDGVSGRGQVQQGADGAGHLGEPSLLQDVQRKTQLSLQDGQHRGGHTAGTKENNGKAG